MINRIDGVYSSGLISQIRSKKEELNRISAKSGSMSGESRQEDLSRIELFEALGHPLRVKIIETLNASPLGFADLKRKVGVESSGHLTFHLNKLGNLVSVDQQGNYSLSLDGREAIRLMNTMAEAKYQTYHAPTTVKEWWTGNKKVASALIIAILILSLGIYISNLNSTIGTLRHQQATQIRSTVVNTWSDLATVVNGIEGSNAVPMIDQLSTAAERLEDMLYKNREASYDFNRFLDSTDTDRSVVAMALRDISTRIFDGTVTAADKEFLADCVNATRFLLDSLPPMNYPPAFLEQYNVANLTTNIENFHALQAEALAILG